MTVSKPSTPSIMDNGALMTKAGSVIDFIKMSNEGSLKRAEEQREKSASNEKSWDLNHNGIPDNIEAFLKSLSPESASRLLKSLGLSGITAFNFSDSTSTTGNNDSSFKF